MLALSVDVAFTSHLKYVNSPTKSIYLLSKQT